MRSVLLVFVCLISSSMLGATEYTAPECDILIQNGRVIDGSGNPWFFADIAIKDGRITAIGKSLPHFATLAIDAKGLVVSPGFIDIHSHSDTNILRDGLAQSKIRQGVTTEILGEGGSAAPSTGVRAPRSLKIDGQIRRWSTFTEYFDLIDEQTISVNIASYVGLSTVWECVMGNSFARPNESQFAEMEQLITTAMQQGALGLSSQVMMPPGSLATTDDLVRLATVVAPFGGLYSTHIRNEGLGVFASVREAISVGERAGIPVDIIHIKIADESNWGRMNEVVQLIEDARLRGVDVQANVYPYTRGNNNLISIIPPWAHEGGTKRLLERLATPADRKQIHHDIINGVDDWYNHYTAVGGDWSRMLISGNHQFRGLTMDRVFMLRGNPEDKVDDLLSILQENGGGISTVFAHHTEKDMNYVLQKPWCSVGSDGSAYAIEGPLRVGNPHPRNFGTFPRVLGKYVRQQKLLSLEDAVRKMTSLNANKVGLRDRGLIKIGFAADIVMFDAETVIDQSTYTDPFAYPTGIHYVVVNGQLTVKDGEHTGARAGRSLRKVAPLKAP
ncbi:MAG TPA: D-aminoacylase [Planctomycetaceae bacterium]|nr:D-aminoacylase [Planctomycetaceae bacterium]